MAGKDAAVPPQEGLLPGDADRPLTARKLPLPAARKPLCHKTDRHFERFLRLMRTCPGPPPRTFRAFRAFCAAPTLAAKERGLWTPKTLKTQGGF